MAYRQRLDTPKPSELTYRSAEKPQDHREELGDSMTIIDPQENTAVGLQTEP
ncbi:MAG TPA: hypothetical protein VN647_05860 [Nitrospira sp.]|nr:hypothetical protein [Nitrospira sp.]